MDVFLLFGLREYVVSAHVASLRFISIFVIQVAWIAGFADGAISRDLWREPSFALPRYGAQYRDDAPAVERIYAHAIELHEQSDPSCVDHFFQVACLTAPAECGDHPDQRSHRLHQSSLQKLVITGQQFQRLDPRHGLTVIQQGMETTFPITHLGFSWQAADFNHLNVVGDYHTKKLSKYYVSPGVGVPLVVTSCRRDAHQFRSEKSVFSATVRLVVDSHCSHDPGLPHHRTVRLELYDPLTVDTVWIGAEQRRIAKDLTAPIAYRLKTSSSSYLAGFLRPNTISPDSGSSQGRLYTLQPYCPGKVPLVLIHGLLSDRFAWAEMANELFARPNITDRFQIWVFEYPTGRTFLGSSAELRQQLEAACQTFDPLGADPQLSNIILAGHSMGGLVAKMQVTASGDLLWRSVANQPLHQIAAPADLRQKLATVFFFSPSPRISRVVYFATPHRGSAFATRLIGRIGSKLVREPSQESEQYQDLVRSNPGVFSQEVTRRIPTSVDLLEPGSELLKASDRLPVRCNVAIHSIIGDRCWSPFYGRSDGIVPVSSAKDDKAISERIVNATHSGVKKHPDAITEFLAILESHACDGGESFDEQVFQEFDITEVIQTAPQP